MKETKFKQTEVGMIPNDWEVKTLGELYKVHNGLSKGKQFFGHGYPFLSFSVVFNNVFIPNKLENLVDSSKEERASYSINKGDVFITRTSETVDELGMSCVALKDYPNATYNGFCKRLRPNDVEFVNLGYLGFYLRSDFIREWFLKFSTVTTRASLKNDELLSLPLVLPPTIEEQQRIANALSDVDTLINNLEKLIAKKKNIKQGAMQQLLTGKIRLDDFSEKWIYVKIKDIFRVTRGYVLNSSLVSPFCDSCTPYPVFSSQTSNKGVMGYYRSYLYENAITWTTDGANAGDVNYRDGRFYCTNVCGVLLSDKGFANECIAGILSLCSKSYVSYVGNPKLMNNVMAEIEILIPPSLEEQTAIANVLSDMDTEISALETKLAKYRTLKTGMMQQLLTGKIRLV